MIHVRSVLNIESIPFSHLPVENAQPVDMGGNMANMIDRICIPMWSIMCLNEAPTLKTVWISRMNIGFWLPDYGLMQRVQPPPIWGGMPIVPNVMKWAVTPLYMLQAQYESKERS